MKRIFKILFALTITFSFCYFVFSWALNNPNNYVYAEEDQGSFEDFVSQLNYSSQTAIANAAKAREEYCDEETDIKGCLYDKNNELYTKLNYSTIYTITSGYAVSFWYITFENGTLNRAYQAFDGQGNAVFVGCYKYKYDPAKEPQKNKMIDVSKGPGTLFVFKFITLEKGKCVQSRIEVVPAIGYNVFGLNGHNDGQTNIRGDYGHQFATFQGWQATDDGDCPNIFAITSNTNVFTSPEHTFIFSATADDFTQLGLKNCNTYQDALDGKCGVKAFLGGDPYLARPGCTVKSEAVERENQILLDGILQDIEEKGKNCPDKIEDMPSYEQDLRKYFSTLKNDNKSRELLSAKYIGETNQTNGDVIYNKIEEKITQCKYEICKLTDDEKKAVEANKGKECNPGCSLSAAATGVGSTVQSSSDDAKCYLCARNYNADKEGVYYWLAEKPKDLHCEEVGREKSKCFGTPSDQACLSCYTKAYNAAKLSDDKKECMLPNDLAAAKTLEDVKIEMEDVKSESKEEEIAENEALVEEMFRRNSPILEQIYLFINDEPMTCIDIVGPVLGQIIKGGITIVQIVAAIIALVKGMLILIPAVVAKDADALKKAGKTLVILGIILALVIIFRPLVRILGDLLEYDTTCIL